MLHTTSSLAPPSIDDKIKHNNIRVITICQDDPIKLFNSNGQPLAVVISYTHEKSTAYRGSIHNFSPTTTFVAPDAPIDFVVSVHLPWHEIHGNTNPEDTGTTLIFRPWSEFARPIPHDSFAPIWDAASFHPRRKDGSFVY